MILSFFLSLSLSICFSPPSSFSMQLTHTLLDLAINSVRFNKRLHLSHCVRQFGGLRLGWRGPTCPINNTDCDLSPVLALNHIWFSIYFTDDLKGVISWRKIISFEIREFLVATIFEKYIFLVQIPKNLGHCLMTMRKCGNHGQTS